MNENEFRVPPECSSLQPPVKLPSPLIEEFMQHLDPKNGTLEHQADFVTMKRAEHSADETLRNSDISKRITTHGGQEMFATFEGRPDEKGHYDVELNGVGLLSNELGHPVIQFDRYTGGPKGALNMDAMVQRYYGAYSSPSAITLEPTTLSPSVLNRTQVDWDLSMKNGDEEITAALERPFQSEISYMSSEIIAATDKSSHKLGITAYTFNPDGQITSCSVSSKLDGDTADRLVWRMKVE